MTLLQLFLFCKVHAILAPQGLQTLHEQKLILQSLILNIWTLHGKSWCKVQAHCGATVFRTLQNNSMYNKRKENDQ